MFLSKTRPHCTLFFLMKNNILFQIHASPRVLGVIRKRERELDPKRKSVRLQRAALAMGAFNENWLEFLAFQEGRGLIPDVNI